MMGVDDFFELFLEELRQHKDLWVYYKFLSDPAKMKFRKAYLCQRLQYIMDHIGPREQTIWDCGCGYGTTALFLAMNGYRIYGTTLEFYFKQIEKRKKFWSRYGNADLFECKYEDLYSSDYKNSFDTIILQDTLHHLEPIGEAVQILSEALRENGKLLVVEENGSNLIQNVKLLKQRGLNKKVEYYDDQLQKTVVFGDENIRSLAKWKKIFKKSDLQILDSSVNYIRLLPPSAFDKGYEKAVKKEQLLTKQFLLTRYFYFGINFMVVKTRRD
jgi:SAM-dependent methyltransferase